MLSDIEKLSSYVSGILAYLKREEDTVTSTHYEPVQTPLPDQLRTLLRIILSYGRIGDFVQEGEENKGWFLSHWVRKDSHGRVETSGLSAGCKKEEIGLGRFNNEREGPLWVKPEQVYGIVCALAALPAIIRRWKIEVERKKAELVEKQADWTAQRKRVEKELIEADRELTSLCQELIRVAGEVVGQTEN